jgi:hypothetical protein
MPLALLAIGALLVLIGLTGKESQLGDAFNQDVMGQGGFLQFAIGLAGIAIFFRLLGMPNAGRFFLVLVLLVFLLQNSNVLTMLENVAAGSQTPGTGTATPGSSPGATPGSSTVAQAPGSSPGAQAPLQLYGAVPATPVGGSGA